jgi:hypothetical protein
VNGGLSLNFGFVSLLSIHFFTYSPIHLPWPVPQPAASSGCGGRRIIYADNLAP